ncbi:MFS transporter [Sphaerisporangium rufum]|uniref:MFS transporter n=1 Tax=Sphaerisporangium rufum TaxID=1381558 RepID=A0A919R432_9ACTN|nr:MFS transporter [Sphaerisporangium rufum]GII78031.1 MFS transporter [Sphaerisporangium rufum]
MSGTARRRSALTVSAAGAMLVALDGTVLLMVQPSLRRDLAASVTQTQWASTGYLLSVAALLVIAGRLGDRYGHRRLLLCGLCGFAAASAGIALAPGIGVLITLRVLQGLFAALLQPATLALLRLTHPADRLGRAIAVRTGAIGLAGAAGPILGGLLVAQLGWRSVFAVQAPIALAVAALAMATPAPPPRHRPAKRFAITGTLLIAGVLSASVYALAGVPAHGWTGGPTLAALACAVGGAVILLAWERRTAYPIVPAAVARSRPVTAAMAILLLTSGGMFGALFVATFLLQDLLRLDPLAAGLRVIPLTILMVLGAPLADAALRRYGPRRTAVAGLVPVVLGILGLTSLDQTGAWSATAGSITAFALLGLGFATVMVTATGTVVGDAPAGHAGIVGGLKQTAMNIGPTLGIAIAAGLMPVTPSGAATRFALPAMAALAALGTLPALLLPARPVSTSRASPADGGGSLRRGSPAEARASGR